MLTLLRRRDFTLVWLSGLISATGDWLLLIGLPVYVFILTNSTLTMANVFILELVPAVAFSTFAGVLADRWNRRTTMITVATAQGVLLPSLLLVHTRDDLWIVYLVAPTQALLAQLYEPAKNAALPLLVPPDQLVRANSLIGLSASAARLIGGALGGLAVASGTLTMTVSGDTASFLSSAALICAARFPSPTPAETPATPPVIRAWREGMAFIAQHRIVRNILIFCAGTSIAQGMFVVLFVVFVTRVLHGGATEVGTLRGVQAIGGVIGGLTIGSLGARLSERALIVAGSLSIALLLLTAWNAPDLTRALGLYIALFIAAGIPAIAMSSGMSALLQSHVPNDHLGRVTGAVFTVYGGCQVLGMLAAGLAGDHVDTVTLLNTEACCWLLSAAVAFFGLRHTPVPSP